MSIRPPALAMLLVGLLLGLSPGGAQPAARGRVVAIGDVHADLGALRAALRLAGAINAADEWIGGALTIVQVGDLIGRSDEERQVLDFIFDLQPKATKA